MKNRSTTQYWMAVVLAWTAIFGFVSHADAQWCDAVEIDKLIAIDGVEEDQFGFSVSISGDTAIVGTAETIPDNPGSAYIFVRGGDDWTQQAKLVPSDGEVGDRFGRSVSISGDWAVIGATEDDDNGINSGSAYVFMRMEGVWTQQAKLLPDDGNQFENFGESVAISGGTSIVGARADQPSGSAYVFVRDESTWTQQAKLVQLDGDIADAFGDFVFLDGETALVGATLDDDNGSGSGSAYIFTRNDGVWAEQAKLLATDGAAGDRFGQSVSLSNNTAIVGAIHDRDNGSASGSAYIFTRDGKKWTQQAKLIASDGGVDDRFGGSVSICGDIAVVGSFFNNDNGTQSGSAYIYSRSGGAWNQQTKILPADGETGDRFGISVSIDQNSLIVGAGSDDDNGNASGSAYSFDLNCGPCLSDLNNDRALNFLDVSAFLDAYGNQDLIADFTGEGVFNFLDVSAFLGSFAAGCP